MTLSRRLVPSLPGLRALEALDRLGSATAVAEELALTQSAVSRQLQTLEAQLGVSLLVRARQRIALTDAGRSYAAQVRGALDQITQASLQLQLAPVSGGLSLAIQPTFAMRWLVPRLPDFAHRHPDVAMSMTTRIEPPDFGREPFDAAIRFGAGAWPGMQSLLLQREEVLPVCAPGLRPKGSSGGVELVLKQPLLHLRTRPNGWAGWLAAQGVDAANIPGGGTMLDQLATMHQAALHGLGIGLLPEYLIGEDLATGRLVRAVDVRPVSLGGNYLTWPIQPPPRPAMTAFRDWLAGQAEGGDGLPR